ncbi:MAG: 1-acyl-sn-glycerol-3-phosphate acyltransferase, partial [Desulfuromonadales bacterium]
MFTGLIEDIGTLRSLRKGSDQAIVTIATALPIAELRLGESIAIFPEGNLSPLSGGCHAPRSGVARLALTTGAPVIP